VRTFQNPKMDALDKDDPNFRCENFPMPFLSHFITIGLGLSTQKAPDILKSLTTIHDILAPENDYTRKVWLYSGPISTWFPYNECSVQENHSALWLGGRCSRNKCRSVDSSVQLNCTESRSFHLCRLS
jgi:hypothetical protein